MGVYSTGELKWISRDGLERMREIHKKDLNMYYSTSDYPNRLRDIKETEENIQILNDIIAVRPS